ncbi:hypothetical protein LP420_30980 [Massilia sp. B-10]|nr:hypothetical protein LP420_30980 [Massilia sp. B-10]
MTAIQIAFLMLVFFAVLGGAFGAMRLATRSSGAGPDRGPVQGRRRAGQQPTRR